MPALSLAVIRGNCARPWKGSEPIKKVGCCNNFENFILKFIIAEF